MDSSPEADWQSIDDDGRDFLERALSEIEVGATAGTDPGGSVTGGTVPGGAIPAEARLIDLLRTAAAAGASDVHLTAGLVPHLRIGGILRPLAGAGQLGAKDLERLITAALSDEQRRQLATTGDLDAGLSFDRTAPDADGSSHRPSAPSQRFRASIFRQSGTLAAAIRIVPDTIPPLGSLGLPKVISRFADLNGGLVLVTGPTGSGKSTTLAALVDQVNHTRAAHIVTIEDPVEYRYAPDRAVIQQREVGTDTPSFAAALRRALRQDPDVILLGELRDLETVQIAVTAAETGHLVLATLHSGDATSALHRIIDVFPAEQQAQVRSQLALSLQGCLSQRLVPAQAGGLLPATEVLVATSAIRHLIRDDKVHQVRSMLETGAEVGMHTFDQSLAALVRSGRVTVDVARSAATSATTLDTLVGQ